MSAATKLVDPKTMTPTGDDQLFTFGGDGPEVRERIRRLRLVRQWDQSTLARRVGVTQSIVSRIESGRLAPTEEQLQGFAKAFGCTKEFISADLGLGPTTRPWLRAYADAGKKEADARTASASVAAEYVRRLGLKPLPDLLPPFTESLDDDDAIEDFAAYVRHLADIEQGSVVPSALRAAERLGCIVLPLESELGRHVGMSLRADDLPIMCVAKGHVPGDRQRWTAAHELGHLTLHADAGPPRDAREARRMENQAHRFAAAFLCPGEALRETLSEVGDGKVTLNALVKVKHVWGVAIKALVHRCQELDIIDADHALGLYKQISKKKWGQKEPVEVPLESAQWLPRTLMRKAQADDVVTACKQLASAIGGNANDLRSFADWTVQEAEVVSLMHRRRT